MSETKERQIVKINKKHGGKEFRSFFHFVGKVKHVRKRDEGSNSWVDVPFVEEGISEKNMKPYKKLQLIVETAPTNELKVELFGMEQDYVYPFSSKHQQVAKVGWSDRYNKEKYPDETYHLISKPDWDKIDEYAKVLEKDVWVEVKGHYEPQEFTSEDGKQSLFVRRVINELKIVHDGQEIKQGRDKITYVTDFANPEFTEVNYFSMQVGIRSTYQDENTGDTKVNGVYLMYGKDRSEPVDVELMVYQKETPKGKRSLADAFATLEYGDFIEVFGRDNNRAEFEYRPVEVIVEDDPFADIDESQKQIRYERVALGTKKGLEITGVVAGTLIRNFLTEEEMTKSAQVTTESPFEQNNEDPFAQYSKPLDVNDDDLPF